MIWAMLASAGDNVLCPHVQAGWTERFAVEAGLGSHGVGLTKECTESPLSGD